mgnify:CR=1 FL=1
MEILFFEPIGRFAIWGHDAAKKYFSFKAAPDGIGQFWSFSAQINASNVCTNPPFEGLTLRTLWYSYPGFFESRYKEFPFIISLVGPEDDLSIQIHPNAAIAARLGFEMGKNEAWYFIKTADSGSIVYGHNAKDEAELRSYISDNNWNGLIKHKKVQPGSFVYIPTGIIHAMGKGSIVYEIQQSTDITYRLYDYDRLDQKGSKRSLNQEEGIECVTYDKEIMNISIEPKTKKTGNSTITEYDCEHQFKVFKLEVNGQCPFTWPSYLLCTIVIGNGIVEGKQVKLGDSFLIPKGSDTVSFEGNMTVMVTCE